MWQYISSKMVISINIILFQGTTSSWLTLHVLPVLTGVYYFADVYTRSSDALSKKLVKRCLWFF